jgi:hypothetical protein
MVKALIILLVPLIGLVALGAQAAGGTSLTGTEIAHAAMVMALPLAQAVTANISRVSQL